MSHCPWLVEPSRVAGIAPGVVFLHGARERTCIFDEVNRCVVLNGGLVVDGGGWCICHRSDQIAFLLITPRRNSDGRSSDLTLEGMHSTPTLSFPNKT